MTFASAFDIVLALVAATLAVRGAFRGLSGEFFSLLGMVGGVILAWNYAPIPARWIASLWDGPSEALLKVISMVIIYILTVLLANLACRGVKAFIKFASLTMVDRVLGVFSGLLKGVFLLLFLYVGITTYSPFLPTEWIGDSLLMRQADALWPDIQALLESWKIFPKDFSLPELSLPDLPSLRGGKNAGI